MDFGDGEGDKPNTSFDIVERHKWHGSRLRIDETPRIEAPLPIIPEKEVPSFRDGIRHFRGIPLSGRVTEGFATVSVIEIVLVELRLPFSPCRCQVDIPSTDRYTITGESDDALDVEALLLIGGTEDHNVSSFGGPKVEGKLIDDDVLVILQCIRHRTPLDLEGRNEEGPNPRDDGNDDDDVKNDVEEMEPEAGTFFLIEHRRIVGGEHRTVQ